MIDPFGLEGCGTRIKGRDSLVCGSTSGADGRANRDESTPCLGQCSPTNAEVSPSGLPFSDTFGEAYGPVNYNNADQDDIYDIVDGNVGNWARTNKINTCALRAVCALNASGMTVPSSKALGSWPVTSGDNIGARMLTEARAVHQMLTNTGVAPSMIQVAGPTVRSIRTLLAEGQVAIMVRPRSGTSSGHVSVITATYSDRFADHKPGDVWLLPVR